MKLGNKGMSLISTNFLVSQFPFFCYFEKKFKQESWKHLEKEFGNE